MKEILFGFFNMANRPQKRSVDDPDRVEDCVANVSKAQKKSEIDSNLHKVKVVDGGTDKNRLNKKLFLPGDSSLEDRKNIFHGELRRAIKRKLWSGRRDDPEVRIELIVLPDVFCTGLGQAAQSTVQQGKDVYSLNENRNLDTVLGVKWDERIFNCGGDFACVEAGTVRYWMTKKTPIKEYQYIGGKFVKCEIEDSYLLVFSFVRGDGNRRQYLERSNVS